MSYYQMSIEDIENQKILQAMSDRTAYIDEYGSFGFDFSSTGASKYYILCAVIVENKDIDILIRDKGVIMKKYSKIASPHIPAVSMYSNHLKMF